MNPLYNILAHAVLCFLFGGSIVAVLVGIGMLLMPQCTIRLNTYLSRWIDVGGARMYLDRPRRMERFVYRHHRVFSVVWMMGAAFTLHIFLLSSWSEQMSLLQTGDRTGVWQAIFAILIIGNVVAFFIGLLVFIRPSLIKEIETAANQWISTDFLYGFFGRMHFTAERFLVRYRVISGFFLLLGGGYSGLTLGRLLFSGDWLQAL